MREVEGVLYAAAEVEALNEEAEKVGAKALAPRALRVSYYHDEVEHVKGVSVSSLR